MRKLISFIAAVTVMACAVFTGCGKPEDPENTLIIEVFDGGYGIDWLEELKKGFCADNSGYNIKIIPSYEIVKFETALLSGKTNSDLFFSTDILAKYQYGSTKIGATVYDCVLESLYDIYYEEKIPGEDKTISEKLNPQFTEFFTFTRDDETENIYVLPWATGVTGLLRNNKVWKSNWIVPNTTNELIALCGEILSDDCIPFIYALRDSYYKMVWEEWAAQYEGVENMNRFWDGYAPNGNRFVPELLLYEGFLEANKVCEELLKESNRFQHSESKDNTFTAAQNKFLDGTNKIAMMVNGDWIQSEMKKNYSPEEIDIEFIKTPIISSLGTKLGITDSELSAIISYVDGKGSLPEFASSKQLTDNEVIEAVRAAREINTSCGFAHGTYIPVYSKQKEMAKKFLQYMASDEGLKIYAKTTGYILPYDYDWLQGETAPYILDFIKNTMNSSYFNRTMYPLYRLKNRIFCMGGLNAINNGLSKFETYFSASNANDYMSAQELYMANYNYVKGRWQTYLTLAGLN